MLSSSSYRTKCSHKLNAQDDRSYYMGGVNSGKGLGSQIVFMCGMRYEITDKDQPRRTAFHDTCWQALDEPNWDSNENVSDGQLSTIDEGEFSNSDGWWLVIYQPPYYLVLKVCMKVKCKKTRIMIWLTRWRVGHTCDKRSYSRNPSMSAELFDFHRLDLLKILAD